MNRQKWLILLAALGLMGGTVGLLIHLRAHQRLGLPGVKTTPLDGIRARIDLPERVLNYRSEALEPDKLVRDFLPPDTSYGSREYVAPDGFRILTQAVLMGTDRTSLHKPQFCLGGQGWPVDDAASAEALVPIEKPRPYDLPVMKLILTRQSGAPGQQKPMRGVFVYWFVADGEYTAKHWQRMWWMLRDMGRSGVLQRWAYISCFSVCPAGGEEATFERMKRFLAASVPQFQLTPGPEDLGLAGEKLR